MPSTDCSLCMHQWRRWIRPLSILFYVVAICIALPLIVIEFQVWNTQIHLRAWFIGGFFVLLAIPISIWGIIQHLIHYTQPHLQRHIIRIIWMVPIYAINAWFALRFKDVAIYLDTARECYEAYVIYNFMAYLLNYLHSEYPDLAGTLSDKPQQKHLIPLCWCPVWPMGNDLITNCKHGVLQYTVVRPVTTIIAFICNLAGAKVYMEGTFSFKSAWTYLVVINNISQIWAMYCLVLFYQATKEELAPIKPIWKFMCVKAVVFLSFWQSVLIAILVQVGVIKANNLIEYDTDDLATGLQDFCICIEMFLASLAHYFSFSHKPYVDYAMGYVNCCDSFAHMWDVSDVRNDVVDHVRHVGKTAQQIVTRRGPRNEVQPTNTERTPLLGSNSESTDEGGLLSSTPPVIIHRDEAFDSEPEEQALEQNFYDEAPNFADNGSINTLEGSTASDFLKKSTTSSMNNFAQFSESIDTGHVQNAEDVNSDSLLVNIDHDSQPVDTHPVSGTSTDSGTVGNNV